MKAVALAAPVLVLGLLHILQKLETWTVEDSPPVASNGPSAGRPESAGPRTPSALSPSPPGGPGSPAALHRPPDIAAG